MVAKKAKPKKKPVAKRGRGRPPKVFDYAQVEALAKLGCTYGEIGMVLGCSHETIKNRKREDPEFLAAYNRGSGDLKKSLRRWMLATAERGSAAVQIFLAKNHLGMLDSPPPPDDGNAYVVSFKLSDGELFRKYESTPDDTTSST